jgi:hypothetical protein
MKQIDTLECLIRRKEIWLPTSATEWIVVSVALYPYDTEKST